MAQSKESELREYSRLQTKFLEKRKKLTREGRLRLDRRIMATPREDLTPQERTRWDTIDRMSGAPLVSTMVKPNGITYHFDDVDGSVTAILPGSARRKVTKRAGQSVDEFFKRCSGMLAPVPNQGAD